MAKASKRRRRREGASKDPDTLVTNLELEDGTNLLLEDGGFILLEG